MIDEDFCFEGFFGKKKRNELYKLFMAHSEINGEDFAMRIHISPADFVKYVSSPEEPSPEIEERIKEGLREIGRELIAIK